jgi:hypothetical protein
MSHPATALKTAVAQRLATDAAVLALLRHPKVHVDPPKAEAFPHVVLETGATTDAGSATEEGHATEIIVRIVARHTGTAEPLAIAAAIEASLAGLPPGLDGHRLVNLVHRGTETRTRADGAVVATMRWRAVTEVT